MDHPSQKPENPLQIPEVHKKSPLMNYSNVESKYLKNLRSKLEGDQHESEDEEKNPVDDGNEMKAHVDELTDVANILTEQAGTSSNKELSQTLEVDNNDKFDAKLQAAQSQVKELPKQNGESRIEFVNFSEEKTDKSKGKVISTLLADARKELSKKLREARQIWQDNKDCETCEKNKAKNSGYSSRRLGFRKEMGLRVQLLKSNFEKKLETFCYC